MVMTDVTVIVLVLAAVVVAVPTPSPKVRLLNVQLVVLPKLPAPSIKNVPPVRLIVPVPVASPPLTVTLFVPDSVPAVMVRSTSRITAEENDQPPPVPLNVTESKFDVPSSIAKPVPVAVKVVV